MLVDLWVVVVDRRFDIVKQVSAFQTYLSIFVFLPPYWDFCIEVEIFFRDFSVLKRSSSFWVESHVWASIDL